MFAVVAVVCSCFSVVCNFLHLFCSCLPLFLSCLQLFAVVCSCLQFITVVYICLQLFAVGVPLFISCFVVVSPPIMRKSLANHMIFIQRLTGNYTGHYP